jgi:hypothetical protein
MLQKFHGLSDDATEEQIFDRTSFKNFLGLRIGDDIPDAKTLWDFKQRIEVDGRDCVAFELLVIGAFFGSCRVHAALGSYPTFAVHENDEGSVIQPQKRLQLLIRLAEDHVEGQQIAVL